jgi:uncharacterized caspase-like protein
MGAFVFGRSWHATLPSIATLLIALFLIASSKTEACAEASLALLIGNSRYQNATPLRNPENDTRVVSLALKGAGFEVHVSTNVTAALFREAFNQFEIRLKRDKPKTALIYFAGHGVQLSGENYLIPIEARTADANSVKADALSVSELLARLVKSEVTNIIIVLDACRDDPFEKSNRSLARGLVRQALPSSIRLQNIVIAFSTAPGKVALDGDGGISPYALAFAESVMLADQSVEELFRSTRRKVFARTQGQQEPWENAALHDRVELVSSGLPRARPSEREVNFWELAAVTNSIEGYQRFLESHPQSVFSTLAKEKIDALGKDFSYRRKSEVFPLVKYQESDFPACGSKSATKGQQQYTRMHDQFKNLNGHVIYLRFSLPLRTINCGLPPWHVDQPYFVAGKGETKCSWHSRGYKLFKKWQCGGALDDPAYYHGALIRMFGGLEISFPLLDADYYSAKHADGEGVVDPTMIEFEGLVKVRYSHAEDTRQVVLTPIDPKLIGMSWKHLNTVELHKKRN